MKQQPETLNSSKDQNKTVEEHDDDDDDSDFEFDPASFFGDHETFVRYLYDEYKQDVPLPCITAHYSEDVEWVFGGVKNDGEEVMTPRFFLLFFSVVLASSIVCE